MSPRDTPHTPVFQEAIYWTNQSVRNSRRSVDSNCSGRVADHVLNNGKEDKDSHNHSSHGNLGTFAVYMTSCETMWGVLIFVKFDELIGIGGLYHTLAAVAISVICQLLASASLSAIATNAKFQTRGAYYLVVRSLGPAVGAAIGMLYFFGMSLLAAVEVIGAAEAMSVAFHQSNIHKSYVISSVYWDQVVFGIAFLTILCLIRGKSIHFVHPLGLLVMGVVIITFLSCIIGLLATAGGWQSSLVTPPLKLSAQNIRDNLRPRYKTGTSFGSSILTLIYPTFIGIFQGANKHPDLRNPFHSIPKGAIYSVVTSGVIYTILFVLLSAVANHASMEKEHFHLIMYLAWPSQWIAIIGSLIIGLGSALSCIDTAPTILQSLANDGYIAAFKPLGLTSGKSAEPRRALFVTYLICVAAMFMKDIETVATYTSLMFLCMYATVNASCFCLSILKLHSWRPKFKYYHWTTALAGLVLSLVIMFWMKTLFAAIILATFLGLIVYVQVVGEKVTWGHGLEGLKYRVALYSLLALEDKQENDEEFDDNRSNHPDIIDTDASTAYKRSLTPNSRKKRLQEKAESLVVPEAKDENWLPQILCFLKLNEDFIPYEHTMLDFIQQLKGSKGLNMVAAMIPGISAAEEEHFEKHTERYEQLALRVSEAKIALERVMKYKNIVGFAEVIAGSMEISETTMVQAMGLGKLRPNTIVCCWPKTHYDSLERKEERGRRFLRFLGTTVAFNKAFLAIKSGTREFPLSSNDPLAGNIDIWWMMHDGGLPLLLGHLLHEHNVWRNCKLRVFIPCEDHEDPIKLQTAISAYLEDVRIRVDLHIIDITKSEISAISNDWTLRQKRQRHRSVTYLDNHEGGYIKKDLEEIFIHKIENPRDASGTEKKENNTKIWSQKSAIQCFRTSLLKYSSKSQLVVLNMPAPLSYQWKNPSVYLDMINDMTEGLKRTILVHGSGNEVLSPYA